MMKCLLRIKIIILVILYSILLHAQGTVTDYDGNVYETITIGDQVWLKENLKSVHYSDGTPIPGAVAYNNDDSLGAIYGLLYSWNAAMNGSTEPGTQGVCPCDWHVPTDGEWTILENYLGGANVAGGEMKETGTEHWLPPNTGATNSSGFTGLPAGEYDAYFNPNKFWLLHTAAVLWTSTQTNQSQAIERYLSHDDAVCGSLAWYKVMKYSIRCIKDSPSDVKTESNKIKDYRLFQNYPNPFNPSTRIKYNISMTTNVVLKIYNMLGQEVKTLINEMQTPGTKSVIWDATNNFGERVSSGVYIYKLKTNKPIENVQYRKMVFVE